MKFIIEVKEGGEMPRYYGLAWRSFYKNVIYGAPVPFHLLIGWGRIWWYRFKYPKYAKLKEPELWANLNIARAKISSLEARLERLKDD